MASTTPIFEREEITKLILESHAASDSLNAEAFSEYFTTDTTLQFNDNPPLKGRAGIVKTLGAQFPHLELMKHDTIDFDFVGDRVYERVDITYLAKGDDQKIVVRAVAASRVVRVEGKLKYSLFEAFGDFGRAWGRLAIVSVKGEE